VPARRPASTTVSVRTSVIGATADSGPVSVTSAGWTDPTARSSAMSASGGPNCGTTGTVFSERFSKRKSIAAGDAQSRRTPSGRLNMSRRSSIRPVATASAIEIATGPMCSERNAAIVFSGPRTATSTFAGSGDTRISPPSDSCPMAIRSTCSVRSADSCRSRE
jgi:hypothetical protein